MDTRDVLVARWTENLSVSETMILERMFQEGLNPYRWSNRAGDKYSPHTHSYNKVIYVIDGSITFSLPSAGQEVELFAGDRLNLRAGVTHGAIVGSDGVICLEAHG